MREKAIKGIGVDVIKISSIREVYMRHGERFLERICLEGEIKYIRSSDTRFFERLASTFCAKEAVFKALRSEQLRFKEIEILRRPHPTVTLYGNTLEEAKGNGITDILVSVSHDGDYCVGFAIAVQNL